MATKALEIMRKAQSVEARADKFSVTIARNIQKDVIDVLITQKEKLEDEIDSILDFSLETNINRGLKQITREEAEQRFKLAIEKGYELRLVKMELKVKTKLFNKYFKDEEVSSENAPQKGGE